jgi:phosphoglycolate phosphatase
LADRVDLIVFDLDGTLVDSSRDLARAVDAALARVAPGAPPLGEDRVRPLVGSGAKVLIERALRVSGLAPSLDVEQVLPVFLECYAGMLVDTTRLYPGARVALERLAHLPLAVLTNKPGGLSRRLLDALGVADRFVHVVGGGDVDARKPDPGGLRWIVEQVGVATDRTLMVGDSAIDIRTGRAARTLTAGVRGGFDPEGVAAEGPDLLLDDLSLLPPRLRELA